MKKITGFFLMMGSAATICAQGLLVPTNGPTPSMHSLEELYQRIQATQQQVSSNLALLVDVQSRMLSAGMLQSSGSMVLIPGGTFVMGACTNVGQEYISNAVPQHVVTVSAFYLERYLVTGDLWFQEYTWATNHGYVFANPGACKADAHPVQSVTWQDAIAWCNARSQSEGFQPCYTNANGLPYTNSLALFSGGCNWSANGYRLPTEAEWERAARGGVVNHRFPWGDGNTIQHTRANYFAGSAAYSYDTSTTTGYHPSYNAGNPPYTSPVGSFAANGLGLYDMAGNVWEWCWDWFGSTYYTVSPGLDPRGPASGTERVVRGGSWYIPPYFARVANRFNITPSFVGNDIGFRCARGL